MDEEIKIDEGPNWKNLKIAIVIALLVSSIIATIIITENKVEDRIRNTIDDTYKVCQNSCKNKQAAFVNIEQGLAQCLCFEITNDGDSTNQDKI